MTCEVQMAFMTNPNVVGLGKGTSRINDCFFSPFRGGCKVGFNVPHHASCMTKSAQTEPSHVKDEQLLVLLHQKNVANIDDARGTNGVHDQS